MGYVKDIFTETVEWLEFYGALATKADEATITDFMEGRCETTRGILPKSLEADLRLDPQGFLESWRDILRGFEDADQGFLQALESYTA